MTLGLVFWILMLLWLVFDVWSGWPNWRPIGSSIIIFLLFLVLGWATFGPPIRG